VTVTSRLACLASAALLLAACGSSSPPPSCDVAAQTGCASGLACEPVTGGAPGCFDPVVVSGKVYDLATAGGLGEARVVALDVNGAPASTVALSNTLGTVGAYSLRIPAERAPDGKPVASVTLRADAQGYEPFPSGLRVSVPVALGGAVHGGGTWTVRTSQTDLGLQAIPGAPAGRISGSVAHPPSGAGVLVVAEAGGAGLTAVPGSDGSFTIFNVADGTWQLRAYVPGFNYAPVTVTVAGGVATPSPVAFVAPAATPATARVAGSVQLVSSTAWNQTSVLLVVASTFDATRIRGVAPAGLRASAVTGSWSIPGIPDGHYRVLAGFETDYLVRDPSDIGGTAVLEFQVVGGVPLLMDGATSAATLQGFKITGAVRLKAPLPDATGACGTLTGFPASPAALLPGACTTTSAAPTIAWETYPATSVYELTVVDDAGAVAWQARVDRNASSVAYGAGTAPVTGTPVAPAPLVAGRTYQVHLTSVPVGGVPLSTSEDLLGVFTYLP